MAKWPRTVTTRAVPNVARRYALDVRAAVVESCAASDPVRACELSMTARPSPRVSAWLQRTKSLSSKPSLKRTPALAGPALASDTAPTPAPSRTPRRPRRRRRARDSPVVAGSALRKTDISIPPDAARRPHVAAGSRVHAGGGCCSRYYAGRARSLTAPRPRRDAPVYHPPRWG